MKRKSLLCLTALLALATLAGGCDENLDWLNMKIDQTRFFSPDKLVKSPKRPAIYPILPSLSPADSTSEVLPGATFPGPDDWTYTDEEYVLGPSDIVDVSVLDLYNEGLETILRREISASGYIDLPQLRERILAEGLTKEKLRAAVRQAYIDNQVLVDPTVSVTIAARRQNTFSILGAISRPGTYTITRKDMRLMDALALGGDLSQTNIKYIYVLRPVPAIRRSAKTGQPAPTRPKPPAMVPSTGGPLRLPELPTLPEDKDKGEQPGPRGATGPSLPAPQPESGVVHTSDLTPGTQPTGGGSPSDLAEMRRAMNGTENPDAGEKIFETLPPPPMPPASSPTPAGANPVRVAAPVPAAEPAHPRESWRATKFVFANGRWVRMPARRPAPARVARREPIRRDLPRPRPMPLPVGPPRSLPAPSPAAPDATPEAPAPAVAGAPVPAPTESPDFEPLPGPGTVSPHTPGTIVGPGPIGPGSGPGTTTPAAAPAATVADAATDAPRAVSAVAAEEDPYAWLQYDRSRLGRVIAINVEKLKAGDPRQNIVVRNNDIINIPPLTVGEFYVMGEVSRPGVYSLTGRRITVKQALAAAGNLGPLAWPENSVLIRRIGPNQEQTIPLNLEAIVRGEEPDLFLKHDDVLAVGTNIRAPFTAVLRNAFRMTYGFGFIYDRNFADPITGTIDSKRFTRW